MRYRVNSRYINDSVGIIVLSTLAAFVVFIIMAGRAQGWFEGTIEVSARFTNAEGETSAEQGSFGLEEGNEVRVRSTRAGQVASIEPGDDGGLYARLIIRKRFHRYIKTDSEALVKKKFGVTGDAFIEISGGTGSDIHDGDTIVCRKDEELFAIAQRAVDQIEAAVVPMLTEATGVISNANRISSQISEGEGIVGAAISDREMKSDIRQSIREMNLLISSSREAVTEATRLIKGAQKSWLVRNHIPDKDEWEYISPLFPLYGRVDASLIDKCETELETARASAQGAEIFRTAYNMAMCSIRSGDEKSAALFLQEALIFTDGSPFQRLHLSAGNVFLDRKKASELKPLVQDLLSIKRPKSISEDAYAEFMALAVLSGLDVDRETALSAMQEHDRLIQKKGTEPARAAFFRTSALLIAESSPLEAGGLADRETAALSQAGLTLAMAEAVASAGDYYMLGGRHDLAALRYLTAGKSLAEQGYPDRSDLLWGRAEASAQVLGREDLITYIKSIRSANSSKMAN